MLISKSMCVCKPKETHVPDWTWHEGESGELHSSRERHSRLAGNHFDCNDAAPWPRAAPVASASSTVAHVGSGETRSTSIDPPSDHVATGPCRLHVQDTFVQPLANATEAKSTIETMDYAPLSAPSKFNLFLKQTIRPPHSCRRLFRRLWTKPRISGPNMGEEYKVGGTIWGDSGGYRIAEVGM
jgi:hypothetical protein